MADVLRAAIKGQPIPKNVWDQDPNLARTPSMQGIVQGPNKTIGTVTGGSAMGRAVAADAASYVGKVPYRWAAATPSGWDCSGFATWVLHHDFGIDLPSNTHTVTGQFLTWGGATTVGRKDMQPGDLVVWPFHMGIAVSNSHMAAAASPALGTIIDSVDWGVPLIRRPNAYGGSVMV
jgi:cell wall-associated NlpC family hydrolase